MSPFDDNIEVTQTDGAQLLSVGCLVRTGHCPEDLRSSFSNSRNKAGVLVNPLPDGDPRHTEVWDILIGHRKSQDLNLPACIEFFLAAGLRDSS